jgi:hypothetical protein
MYSVGRDVPHSERSSQNGRRQEEDDAGEGAEESRQEEDRLVGGNREETRRRAAGSKASVTIRPGPHEGPGLQIFSFPNSEKEVKIPA